VSRASPSSLSSSPSTHPTLHVRTKSCARALAQPGWVGLQRRPLRSIKGNDAPRFPSSILALCKQRLRLLSLPTLNPHSFIWCLTNMSRHEAQLNDLWEKAITKDYKQEAHRIENSKRNSTTYVLKTLKDQNGALKCYKKWVSVSAQPNLSRPCWLYWADG